MTDLNELLFANQRRMRLFNQTYVYAINLLHIILDLMPPFVRNFIFRIMLGKSGNNVFFDYAIYMKFPWLVEMGSDISVNRGVRFFPALKGRHKIIIGNDVYIAPNVGFFASGHDVRDLTKLVGGDIVVGDHVWIGADAIILPGVTIGPHTVIGAGSVVTRDIEGGVVAAGNPARVIRTVDKSAENE